MAEPTEEERLYSSIKDTKFLITGFKGHEGTPIKKNLYSKGLRNIEEIKDCWDAWEKLELAVFNFIIINVDFPSGDEVMERIVDSHRFEETPIILFSRSPEVYRDSYAQRTMIGSFIKLPFNLGSFEKELLQIAKKGIYKKNKISNSSEALQHYNKATNFLDIGRPDDAKEELKLCLKADPNFIDGYIKAAEAMIEIKDFGNATHLLKKTLELSPRNARALNLVGIIMAHRKRKDAAIEAFDKARQSEPNNINLMVAIGNTCLEHSWIDEAIGYFDRVKQKHPNFLDIYNRIGIALSRGGRFEEAEEEYNKALLIDERDAGIYFNLGMLWLRRKEKEKAAENFKKAYGLDPEMKEAEEMARKYGGGK